MDETAEPGVQADGTWKIAAHRMPELRRRVEVLNRRVQKTGGEGLTLETVERVEEEHQHPETKATLKELWEIVKIGGQVPVIDGWTFVARIEHHDELGNIVSVAPAFREDEGLFDGFGRDPHKCDNSCDHCKARRNRKDTFVVSKDGEYLQVGRTCLKDFLRGTDPAQVLSLWSLIASVESLLGSAAGEGYGLAQHFGTLDFLAASAAAIRHFGWVSKSASRASGDALTPTANHAGNILSPPKGHAADWVQYRPTDEDYEEAGAVVEWTQEVSGRGELNDYLSNLVVAVALGYVEPKHEGIVASGVMAYRRELEKAEREKSRARGTGRESNWVGSVGDRMDLSGLRVIFTLPLSTSFLVKFEDRDGNILTWFATHSAGIKEGDVMKGKATIKAHDKYKGDRQTIINRCKLEADPEPWEPNETPSPPVPGGVLKAEDFRETNVPF